mmetsp:Transcript_15909/g.28535  ORF Transcript_15909/g.28535 Transcript_15909/m.28535 type:complete len:162 (+) Transcript_15909:872-1357(+)
MRKFDQNLEMSPELVQERILHFCANQTKARQLSNLERNSHLQQSLRNLNERLVELRDSDKNTLMQKSDRNVQEIRRLEMEADATRIKHKELTHKITEIKEAMATLTDGVVCLLDLGDRDDSELPSCRGVSNSSSEEETDWSDIPQILQEFKHALQTLVSRQ